MNLLINLLLAVYVMVALLMVLVILMQRPKSEGLGAAFGSIALQASLILRGAGEDALTMTDFRAAFAAVAVMGALALPGYLGLSREAGAEVSGHRAPAKREP